MTTGRLEAFSDGVFAIAITLLVLDVHVPLASDLGGGSLLHALLRQWPVYLAYMTSFLTILIMWVNHHQMFARIGRVDHSLLFLNGLLLMSVSIVPFPTSLVAAYLQQRDGQVATAVYSGTFVAIAVLFNLLWRYAAYEGRLLESDEDPRFVRGLSRQYLLGPPAYFAAFVLAFVSVWASVSLCMLLAIFFALPIGTSAGALERRS